MLVDGRRGLADRLEWTRTTALAQLGHDTQGASCYSKDAYERGSESGRGTWEARVNPGSISRSSSLVLATPRTVCFEAAESDPSKRLVTFPM